MLPKPNIQEENDTLLKLIQETNKNLQLSLENQQLQVQLGKQFSTIKIFESNWKKLEHAFDELATEHYQLETENKELLRELDNLNTKNKQLEDELDFIQQELLLKDGEVGLLERQKNQLEKHNHKLTNQRKILQQDYQATIRKFIATRAANKANNRMTEREREREREQKCKASKKRALPEDRESKNYWKNSLFTGFAANF